MLARPSARSPLRDSDPLHDESAPPHDEAVECSRDQDEERSGGGVGGDEEAVGLVSLVDQVQVHVHHQLHLV